MKKQIKRALVVDDIINNCLLITSILEDFDWEYQIAYNGKEALKYLEKQSFNIIFMDIEMPVMNGIEATKLIRDTLSNPNKNIPIIATTAFENYSQKEDIVYGITDYLLKPFNVDKIQAIIEKHIDKKQE